MRRRTAVVLAAAALLVGWAAGRWPVLPRVGVAEPRTVVAVVDAEVPGTKVFLRGQLLGEVPLELTRERLAELGLDRTASQHAETLDCDGWGEALYFGRMDEDELKLTLQVPDAHAARFLSNETPWGRRTKLGMWDGGGHGMQPGVQLTRAYFQAAQTTEGLQFRIALPEQVKRGTKTVAVELTGRNAGPAELTGRRPSYSLLWGGFDTPWRRRVCLKDLPLPPAWERIAPGDTARAVFEMDVPPVSGDYSVFAVFGYDEPAEGAKRKPAGSYSNSALLRVR